MRNPPRIAREAVRRVSDQIAATVDAHAVQRNHGQSYAMLSVLTDRYGYREHALAAAELSVFSQNGEDGVIAELFHRLGTAHRKFVEFGAHDGVQNNTAFLADVLGWGGLLIEADERAFARLRRKYANSGCVETLRSYVTPANVNDLFRNARIPEDVDLVSIDVDGQDYWIWEALTYARPRVLVIEYNSGLPADAALAEPRGTAGWQDTDFFGASIGAMQHLGRRKGYTLVHQEMAGVNAFFVRDDLVPGIGDSQIIRRGPNYELHGNAHPPDETGRQYVAVD